MVEAYARAPSLLPPLDYREEPPYIPLGNRDEQTRRPRPGHPRPPGPEDPRAPADARLGHQPPLKVHLDRGPQGERGLALSIPPQARAGGVDQVGMEDDGEQPARQVLFADAPRKGPARDGDRELAAPLRGDHARGAALGDLAVLARWWFKVPLKL